MTPTCSEVGLTKVPREVNLLSVLLFIPFSLAPAVRGRGGTDPPGEGEGREEGTGRRALPLKGLGFFRDFVEAGLVPEEEFIGDGTATTLPTVSSLPVLGSRGGGRVPTPTYFLIALSVSNVLLFAGSVVD